MQFSFILLSLLIPNHPMRIQRVNLIKTFIIILRLFTFELLIQDLVSDRVLFEILGKISVILLGL